MVICQLPSGQTLADQNCDVLEKPISSQHCGQDPCQVTSIAAVTNQNAVNPHWQKGPWSPVSIRLICALCFALHFLNCCVLE